MASSDTSRLRLPTAADVAGIGVRVEGFAADTAAHAGGPAHEPPDLAAALADLDGPKRRPSRPSASSWRFGYVVRLVSADASAAAMGSVVAAAASGTARWPALAILVPAYTAVWVLTLGFARTFETRRLGIGSVEYTRVFRSGVGVFAAYALAEVLLRSPVGRPATLGIFLTVGIDLIARFLLRRHLYRARWRGRFTDRVVAVGPTNSVVHLVAALRREAHHGLEVVGACVTDFGHVTSCGGLEQLEHDLNVAVLGGPADVPAAVLATKARVVTIAVSGDFSAAAVRTLAWSLEEMGTEVLVSPGLVDVSGQRLTLRPYPSVPLIHVQQPRLSGSARALKGMGDRIGAGLLLVMLSPLLAAVAILVHATSPGGVFHRQTRIGLGGEQFQLWKFRSMIQGADDLIESLESVNETDGLLFKMRRDPRVTPLGAILRRFSVDELPQLFNVLAGSMSLVGPRPPLPREVAQYDREVHRRLLVRPGMTGLWQVSGRSELSWEDSVRLDLRYVENWSVGLDLSILWHTVNAVFSGRGAY